MPRNLTPDQTAELHAICERTFDALDDHRRAIADAGGNPGRLADAIAAAQADLAAAYADVTAIVAGRK